MKIVLTKNEMRAITVMKNTIRSATSIFRKLGNNRSVKKHLKEIENEFRNNEDKWGNCRITDDGMEINMKEDATIDYLNISQNIFVKYAGVVENFVTSLMSFGSFIDSLEDGFDDKWKKSRYIRASSIEDYENDEIAHQLENKYALDVEQLWILTNDRGIKYYICRDTIVEKECGIYIFRDDFSFMKSFTFNVGNSVSEYYTDYRNQIRQDISVAEQMDKPIKALEEKLERSPESVYKMSVSMLKGRLSDMKIIKEGK